MTRLFITLATLSFIIVSCNKMKKTPGGLEYRIFKSHDGAKIGAGDLVFFKLVGKIEDSVLYNTYKNTQNPYTVMSVKENFKKGTFEEGLTLLGKDDSALFVIKADSFFKNFNSPTPDFIKKGASLKFYIKIDSFTTKKEIENKLIKKQENEPAIIEEYIKNSGEKYTKTASGLYYVITKAANGPVALTGDTINANYTGKFLDGKVFDSNEGSNRPFQFILGKHQVISGWDEIFGILHAGEKAAIVVPSSLAYGPEGFQGIEPYTPLYFEVELIKINKSKK